MEELETKYAQAERGRLYLHYKCEGLEQELSELKSKIHEMGHLLEEANREKEYWQNIASRG